MTSHDPLLTIKEAAALLRISVSSVYALASGGRLRVMRVGKQGGSIRVRASELQRYLTACESPLQSEPPKATSHPSTKSPPLKHLRV